MKQLKQARNKKVRPFINVALRNGKPFAEVPKNVPPFPKLNEQKPIKQPKPFVLHVPRRALALFQVVNLQVAEVAYRVQVLVVVRLVDKRANVY